MDLIISGDLPISHKIDFKQANNGTDDSSEESPVLPVNPKKTKSKPTPINLFEDSSEGSISSKSSNGSSTQVKTTKVTGS
jgi:hypothetical protein